MKIQDKIKKLRKNKGLAQKQPADAPQVARDYPLGDMDDEAENIVKIQDQR